MDEALLAVLRCPADGAALTAADGVLACPHGHAFGVREGIPRVLAPDAPPAGAAGTHASFEAKWRAYPEADRRSMAAMQERWYDERFGWDGDDDLGRRLAGCERVLDAGSGLGYDAARYARLTGGLVVGLDVTDAVEIAAADHRAANLRFVQGDLTRPPLAPGTFDFVVADQVIHHTPDARAAFLTLARLLAPGGELSVYVYRRKGLLRELADDHVRARTTAMSVDECLEFAEQVTELGRELSRVGATVTLERGIPLLGIAPGEHDVQRLLYWHVLKCYWNEELGQRQSVMTNFDWYHPPHASRHTAAEVRGWCREAGLEVAHLSEIESGISVRARRP